MTFTKPTNFQILIVINLLFIISCLILLIVILKPSSNEQTFPFGSANEISSLIVTKHNIQTDCWMSIGGSVYDMSRYFINKPSTELAQQLCGQLEPTIELPKDLKNIKLTGYRIGLLSL